MSEQGFQTVTTEDGRDLEVLTGGRADGFPWLFHSGSPSAAVAYAPIDEAARDQGLRLITYSRPGYGASSPRPWSGAGPQMADDVADAVTILDALGAEKFVTLGWSGGGPRALACAALLPDRCLAAATLAGVAPYDGEGLDWTAGMAPDNVEEYAAATAGPEAYEAYLTQEFLPMLQAGPDDVRAALGGLLTPVDQEFATGDVAAYLAESFGRAGAQGVVGVRDDGLAAMRPWGFDLKSITVPVAVWQGREDAMVPFAHGQWLARHVPTSVPHLLDDEGHLSLLAQLPEMLTELRRLAGS